MDASSTLGERARGPSSGWRAELLWLFRAAGWSLFGATIAYGAFLFRMGPDYFASSDVRTRSYRWWEHVVVPLAALVHPFNLFLLAVTAACALVLARILVRRRHLARCALFCSACVGVYAVTREAGRYVMPPVGGMFVLLCAALCFCRILPGRVFAIRSVDGLTENPRA